MGELTDIRRAERTQRIQGLLALRLSEPALLAKLLTRRYVRRGAWWLRRNAPNPGYWRNCLDGGRSRVCLSYGEESPAALAFEYDARFADEFGYVQDWKVLPHFFGKTCHPRVTLRYGLACDPIRGATPYPKYCAMVVITPEMLDTAWAEFLENPPGDWRINYRQPDSVYKWMVRNGIISPRPEKARRFRLPEFFRRKSWAL